MKTFEDFLAKIDNTQQRERTAEVLAWVHSEFPELEERIAWSQPMFTDHGTFILGFSVSKKHLAISPEKAGLDHFTNEIAQAGYNKTKMLLQIPWESDVNYSLLKQIIEFNIMDKAECTTFWRK